MSSAASTTLSAVDLLGTYAFATSGALLAVRKDYDAVGIALLACCTAFGGGVIRDLIIGTGVPTAFTDQHYLWTSLLAAAVVFFRHPPARLIGRPLATADAIGLGLFCVTGTLRAYQHGLGAVPSALLGVVTACGGGALRDVLARETPSVLRRDREIYAVPALLGAGATASLLHFGVYSGVTGAAAAVAAVAVRLLALRYHWHAPRARRP